MENKKLEKILVVEDNPKHLADARAFFDKVEGVEVYYATAYDEAVENYIDENVRDENLGYKLVKNTQRVDGVITDIYLPLGARFVGRKNDEDPVGLLVAAKCHMEDMPFVFCTAGYHHGVKYNWINMLQRTMHWPEMIDVYSYDDEQEADQKPWDEAYTTLKELVNEN